jgi:hypothetical protein
MLPEIHAALRTLLYERGQIDPAEVDISFEAPTREQQDRLLRPTLNFYMLGVVENTDLRQNAPPPRRVNGHSERRLAPLRIDLSYLVSALTGDIDDEHRLLWRALETLLRHRRLPEELLPEMLRDLDPPLTARVAQPEQAVNAFAVWGQLDAFPRAAFAYTLAVPLDLDIAISAPLVLTRTVRYARSLAPDATITTRHQIGGVVRDKAGAPIPDATVALDGSALSATSDARGEFTLTDVPEGVVKLRVAVNGKERVVELRVPDSAYVVVV